MAKLSVDEILDAIKELSIIEAADLSKKIEEEFGIQAAAPMAVGVAAGGGGGAAGAGGAGVGAVGGTASAAARCPLHASGGC